MNWWVMLAGIAYIGASYSAGAKGSWWFSGMYLCYFLANVCVLMAELRYK